MTRRGYQQKENPMYIGGILGTILVIALIVFLVRRA
jgi:nitrate reductase gamma subunit